MVIKIEVLEEMQKGSNPGRKVSFPQIKSLGDCYLKYCPASRGKKYHGLSAHNQPFYEAITNHLCREIGVSVPRTFVLRDGKGSVDFVGNSFNGGREYFVSEWKNENEGNVSKNSELVKYLISQDRLYLELLGVEDVLGKKVGKRESIGKRDNYHFVKYPGGKETGGEITYIDLGCSLGIRAKEGEMEVREKIPENKKELKRMKKRISPWHIISRDEKKILPLEEMIERFEEIPIIELNDRKSKPIKDYLTIEEIDQLRNLFMVTMYSGIKKNKEENCLIKQ